MKAQGISEDSPTANGFSRDDGGVPSGEGGNAVRRVHFGGLTTICHVPSSATGSAALLEHILAPRYLGAPAHRHLHEDEISHVLSGKLAVLQDGRQSVAGPGETIVKPRGVMHTFWNPADEPVRFLEVVAPGTGFERYFEDVAPLIPDGQAPDIPGILAVAARYGLDFDMSEVPALLAEHGLRM